MIIGRHVQEYNGKRYKGGKEMASFTFRISIESGDLESFMDSKASQIIIFILFLHILPLFISDFVEKVLNILFFFCFLFTKLVFHQ